MIAVIDVDSCIYQAAWQQETIESALENYKAILQKNWVDPVWSDEQIIYCGGKDNFRLELCPQYKANRKEPPKDSLLFRPLTERIIEEGLAIPSHGMEADDMVRIKSIELTKAEVEHTVVHIDKDLNCIVGKHYNPKRSLFYEVEEDDADLHYWLQMLKGDPTDNLPGLPKIGPIKAEKILQGVPLGKRKEKVISSWKEFYKENWKEKLLETANGIHILRSPDDYFKI